MPKQEWDPRRTARELGPLLVALCRRDGIGAPTDAELRVLDDGATSERFVDFADRHGVLGLALATLARARARGGAGAAGALLGDRLRGCRRRAAAMELGRDRVLAVLHATGIHPVVLKGAGLATSVYRESAERNFGDIDLLLAPDAIDRAMSALGRQGFRVPGAQAVEAGYRAHHFHVRVGRPDGFIVELHWALTRAMEPFHLDASAFLTESVVVPAALPMRVPRPEHALLHIVAECVRDGFDRLTRLVDVDRIVAAAPALDWHVLEAMARDARLLPTLALALELAHDMLGTALPDDVRQRIRPSVGVRAHLALLKPGTSLLRQRAVTRPSWLLLLQLWLLSGESRAAALARMARGEDVDPLEWVWRGDDSPDAPPPTAVHPVERIGKLAMYQLGLYARGVAAFPRSWSGAPYTLSAER
jgi:hypothetical protein